ncbi:MAG: sulfatase-like hydrolase/transferase [Acidobacteria bacterium]|nr:sulfatase-like hydrolase/transferase [Acidobacteriota bacterium]MCI0720032.1 sulfatase-like hydrolase/transferase [Acidobacteriota bacterium]
MKEVRLTRLLRILVVASFVLMDGSLNESAASDKRKRSDVPMTRPEVAATAQLFPGRLTGAPRKLEKPNIILILADDLGHEGLSCYGSKDYHTPHLDALARAGTRFDHCYSTPACSPSRVQIMTGRYNHRNYQGWGYLNPREVTFANLLQRAGYRTCISGKWQLGGDSTTVRNFGFEEQCLWNMLIYQKHIPQPDSLGPKGNVGSRYWSPILYVNGKWIEYGPDQYGPDISGDFIVSFMKRHQHHPFFVYHTMMLTHGPLVYTPDSTERGSKDRKKTFADMVKYTDKLVGRIVSELKALGLYEKTLLIFTTDNGTSGITTNTIHGKIQGGKGKTTDAGTHVPLIANWPGVSPGGKVSDNLVDFSDFLPTLAEAAGVEVPADRVIDGRSFLPQIRGEKGNPRDWIFCHYWDDGRYANKIREFARDKRWKLYNDGEMYDLTVDPLEMSPLKQLDGQAAKAKSRLKAAFRSVGSQLSPKA